MAKNKVGKSEGEKGKLLKQPKFKDCDAQGETKFQKLTESRPSSRAGITEEGINTVLLPLTPDFHPYLMGS